jgi:hypothetical protein
MRRTGISSLLALVAVSVTLLLPKPAVAISSGNILVVDSTAGSNQLGAIFIVDQQTGQRKLLSDFGNASQGPLGVDPEGIAWLPWSLLGPPPTIVVIDGSAGTNQQGAVFAVNPQTGQRSLLSDFGNSAQGPLGQYPVGITVVPAGILGLGQAIVVADAFAGTNGQGALFKVDPVSGQRTLLSDFGLLSQGPAGVYPDSVAWQGALILPFGSSLLVTDGGAGTNGLGALFSVNPFNGQRTLVSDFGNSGQGYVDSDLNSFPNGSVALSTLLLASSPLLLVADASAGTNEQGALFTINPSTGKRTLLSDFGDSAQGPLGLLPNGVVLLSAGYLVSDGGAGTNQLGALFTVNPETGQRTLLSDFGDSSQGSLGSYPTGIAIVP